MKKTANKGPRIDDDDEDSLYLEDDDVEVDEETFQEVAATFARFFPLADEKQFALFVEAGLDRNTEVQLTSDFHSLHMKYKIPLPDDSLIHAGGFAHASQFPLVSVNADFYVAAPSKIVPHTLKKINYPNDDLPIWFIYKCDLEQEEVPDPAISSNKAQK